MHQPINNSHAVEDSFSILVIGRAITGQKTQDLRLQATFVVKAYPDPSQTI